MDNNFEHPLVYTLIYQKPARYDYERGHPCKVIQIPENHLFCGHDFDKLIERLSIWLIQDKEFFLSDGNFTDYIELFINGFHLDLNTEVFYSKLDYTDLTQETENNIESFRQQVINILTKYKEQIDQQRIQHKIDERVKEQRELNKKLDLQRAEQQRLEYEYFIQLKQKFEGKNINEIL